LAFALGGGEKMLRKLALGRLFITILCLGFLVIIPARADQSSVGLVKVIDGPVDVVRENAATRMTLGSPVYLGDIIRTSASASVGIVFQDETTLSLGPNGEIEIDEFVFDPADNKLSFITNLVLGVLTFKTGEIAKLNPAAVTVNTPLATIGIRGTRFAVSVETP